jgi:Uma2 family endonuclease
MGALKQEKVSEEEFAQLVLSSDIRYEWVEGQMRAMAGGDLKHSQLIDNLAAALKPRLRGQKCRAAGSNFHIKVEEDGSWFVPDNAIYCDKARFISKPFKALLDPVVIFEVLSPSTEKTDRSTKFDRYSKIGALKDYVLITREFVRVEHFERRSDGWLLHRLTTLEDVLNLVSVSIQIPLAELYDDLDIPIQLTLLPTLTPPEND